MNSKIVGIVLIRALVAALSWFTTIGGTAYLYALHLEDKWRVADPKTKAELEEHLKCYSIHEIEPKTSMWGNRYQLQQGERMMQYRILWHTKCPFDVVFDQEDNIKSFFTSYE